MIRCVRASLARAPLTDSGRTDGKIREQVLLLPSKPENLFSSTKKRKSQNKSISYLNSARHPSGESIKDSIYLNLFVFLLQFVGFSFF
jgi:hypothetical protein